MPMLIIFDWDGTIADSVNAIISCKKFLARKYGLPSPTEETIKQVLGMKFEDAMSTCFPSIESSTLNIIGQEFKLLMQTEKFQAALFPEIIGTLLELKKHGIKLAVATSKSREELNQAMAHTGLLDIFDATCCSEEYKAKPDPCMLQHLMQMFDTSPEECLMVGDTIYDIEFAKNAKIKAIGVTFGAHSAQALTSAGASTLIKTWTEFLDILHLEPRSAYRI